MILKDPSVGRLRTYYIRAREGLANEFLVLRKEAQIKYMKTKLMLADCMTKPLRGADFSNFKDRIMNVISEEEMTRQMTPARDVSADQEPCTKVVSMKKRSNQLGLNAFGIKKQVAVNFVGTECEIGGDFESDVAVENKRSNTLGKRSDVFGYFILR